MVGRLGFDLGGGHNLASGDAKGRSASIDEPCKTLGLNPYEKLFTTESSPEVKEEIEKINLFLQLALPAINAGRKPDIEALAKQAGVDVSLAEQLVANTMEKVKGMWRGKR